MKKETPAPTYIQVRAEPGSRKESVAQMSTTKWKVSVREHAEQGAANVRIRTVLAGALGVDPKALRLVKGATSPSKLYLLTNHPQA
jgi:uncharacterized protein